MKRFSIFLLIVALLVSFTAIPATADISVIQRKLVDAKEDNEILHEFENRLGFKINYTWKPAENYASQCAIVVASGDYPDMMEYWSSSYPVEITQMAEDGIIMPLNDLLEQYGQNILSVFPKDQFLTTEDGKIWTVPSRNCEIGTDCLFIIREDWLKNVGMTTPTTLDELYEVLVAFRDQDANGNGDPTDEIPWGYAGSGVGTSSPLMLISTAYDVLLGWNDVNGELVYYVEMPAFKEALRYMRKLYQEGLIEPEYTVLTRDTYMEKKNANRIGVEGWWFTELDPAVSSWSSDFFASNPGASFDMIEWFEGPDGIRRFTANLANISDVIFADSENAAECIQYLDYLVSAEGYDLTTMGIKDVHWSEEDGVITRGTYSDAEGKEIGFNMHKWLCMRQYVPRSTDAHYMAFVEKNANAVVWQPTFSTEEKNEYWSELEEIFSNLRDKLITDPSIDFDAEFNNMVDTWKKNGGDLVTQSMNRVYQAQ